MNYASALTKNVLEKKEKFILEEVEFRISNAKQTLLDGFCDDYEGLDSDDSDCGDRTNTGLWESMGWGTGETLDSLFSSVESSKCLFLVRKAGSWKVKTLFLRGKLNNKPIYYRASLEYFVVYGHSMDDNYRIGLDYTFCKEQFTKEINTFKNSVEQTFPDEVLENLKDEKKRVVEELNKKICIIEKKIESVIDMNVNHKLDDVIKVL